MSKKQSPHKQEIDLLRIERAKAIDECEFAKARQIDSRIKLLQVENESLNTEKERTANQLEYEIQKELVKKKALEEYSNAFQEVCQIKSNFQVRLSELQKIHAAQLAEHAQQYARDLEVAMNRGSIEADKLVKEAQINARAGQFDAAESLYAESNKIREQERKQREEEVRNHFTQSSNTLKEKQVAELTLCRQKLQNALEQRLQKYNEAVETMKRRLQTAALKLKVEYDEEEAAGIFQELSTDKDSLFPPTPSKSRSSPSRSATRSTKSSSSPSRVTPKKSHSPKASP